MGADFDMGEWDMGGSGNGGYTPLTIHDYYTVHEFEGAEVMGVLARKDFGGRAEIINSGHGPILKIKGFGKELFDCKPISEAEYGTYIEFGIPDMGLETSWKKWAKNKLSWRRAV